MKSFFVVLVMLQYFSVQSQVKWDGEGNDGKWNTPSNWVGNILPAAGDQVILDNTLHTGNFNVTLPDSSVTIVSLTILPSIGNTIQLILPTSNILTANAFVATGDVYGLVINNGGIFQNSSGSASGTVLSISDSIQINNGGRYKHNTRSAHATYVSILSRSPGTENGIFEYDVPTTSSYAVSVSNRVYGSLVFSATAAGGLKSYFSSGSNPMTIRGNWEINTGVTYGLDLNDTVFVEGNFLQHTSSKFNIANGMNSAILFLKKNIVIDTILKTGTGSPQIHIVGNTNQSLTSTASLANQVNWVMNNSAGATLSTNLSLASLLKLQAGKIFIGSNILSVGGLLNASVSSYIVTNGNGFLVMPSGNNPVIFPVGPDSLSYNPVTITNGSGVNYSIRVETGINPMIAFPTYGINRTWNIFTSTSPLTPVTVGFQYNSSDANTGCSPSGRMEILKYIPSAWNIISTDLVPSGNDPFIVTASINSFNTPFAIGSNGGWTLPLQLVYFDAVKLGRSIVIKWILSAATSTDAKIEIEYSHEGSFFYKLATVQGKESTRPYHYVASMMPGITYYRLRLIDVVGNISYSRIVRISKDVEKTYITSVKPQPVHNSIKTSIVSPRDQKIIILVADMMGRILINHEEKLYYGTNSISINCDKLSTGMYQFFGITPMERTNIISFVKF